MHNCFSTFRFGGCSQNVYGDTPAEILHVVLLCLCEYIAEGIKSTSTVSAIAMMSHVIVVAVGFPYVKRVHSLYEGSM